MENVSKALLIAGGILIAIVILSMFLMMYNNVADISRSAEAKKEQEQLLTFNRQYEAYDKKFMYGVDVITLCNKIRENNRSNHTIISKITLVFEEQEIDKIELKERYNTTTNQNEKYAEIFKDNEKLFEDQDFSNFDKKLYKCVGIYYNNDGRVSKIYINKAN